MSDTLRALEDARDLISASAQLDAHNWRDGQPITEYGQHVQGHLDQLDVAIEIEKACTPMAWAVLCASGAPHVRELHPAPRKSELLDLDRRMCDAQGCGPHRIVPLFAGEVSHASMDKACEEGRREERRACMAVAQAIAERYGPTQQAGRIETALQVRDMIAARGPMEE